MTWRHVHLGELLEPAPVRRAGRNEYPILSMTMRDGLVAQSDKFKKRVASRDTANYRVIKRGELVVGFPIDEAVLAVQRIVDEGIVSPAYKVWKINSSRVDSAFLERYLRSNMAISYYKANLRGTTARRRTLPSDKFHSMPVPLPEIEQQRKVIKLIDKADDIRRRREQALSMADTVLRSAFMEKFGDPLTNRKGLPKAPIKEFGKVVTGNTPSRKNGGNFGNSIEWIKSDNINTPNHFLTPAEEHLSETGRLIGRMAPAGSTLVTCIAGSPSVIGNAALADREVAFNQQINAVIPNADVDPYFLYCQFLISKKLIQSNSTNSMKGMVSKGKLQEIEFLLPSREEQQEFGRFFKRVIEIISHLREGLGASQELLESVSARAFRGEL